MKCTLKWYEPVGSDVILKEEEFIRSMDPTKYDYPEGRHALMLRLSLPLLLNVKEENKIYWNRCEVIKEERDPELIDGMVEMLTIYGDGHLYRFDNEKIGGLVFGKNAKHARQILEHGLKENNLPDDWSNGLEFTEGNNWKYKPPSKNPINYRAWGYSWGQKILLDNRKIADAHHGDTEKAEINVHYTQIAGFDSEMWYDAQEIMKIVKKQEKIHDERKIKELRERIAAPKPDYFTNRHALALLTSLVHDLKTLKREWVTYKKKFGEDQEKIARIKDLMDKIAVVADGFNDDYINLKGNESMFYRFKPSADFKTLEELRIGCFKLCRETKNLDKLMNSGTHIHRKQYPNGDKYAQVKQLYEEMKDRVEPMTGGPYSMDDLNYMARDGIVLPFIEVYYPSIAKSLRKMKPEEAKQVEKTIIKIIEHDTNLFSHRLSRDYLDSVMYSALIYSFPS